MIKNITIRRESEEEKIKVLFGQQITLELDKKL